MIVRIPPMTFTGQAEKVLKRHTRRLAAEFPACRVSPATAVLNMVKRELNREIQVQREVKEVLAREKVKAVRK